jgi:hypothetical protein
MEFETLAVRVGSDPLNGAVTDARLPDLHYIQDGLESAPGYEYRTKSPARLALENCLAALAAACTDWHSPMAQPTPS